MLIFSSIAQIMQNETIIAKERIHWARQQKQKVENRKQKFGPAAAVAKPVTLPDDDSRYMPKD